MLKTVTAGGEAASDPPLGVEAQSSVAGHGAHLLPRMAPQPADPVRPGGPSPLVAFSYILSFISSFLLCFLSHLTCPGAIQFTDGRYWIYSPHQRRLRAASFSSGTVSEHASTQGSQAAALKHWGQAKAEWSPLSWMLQGLALVCGVSVRQFRPLATAWGVTC